ncbi:MAG: hypothetical protein RMX68_003650 [Aulosira sp. ZfuVER01]|nr:hypothetical protein [Aulosira sp. DedVER01a]MDZ8051329.1 hypothetical protein [Aulosira sp. ZfuCHP01]
MLMSVGGRYGKDSAEYVQAGGVRKSDGFANAKGERIRKGAIARIKSTTEKVTVEPTETA